MKLTYWILAGTLALGVALAWAAERGGDPTTAAVDTAETRILLAVPSMTCGSCEGRIRAALDADPRVRGVTVDLGSRTVEVVYAADVADPKTLADAVTRAGYPARYLPPDAPRPAAPKARSGCGGGCCGGAGVKDIVQPIV